MRLQALFLTFALSLAACTPPPPVAQSQDILWKQFGHQSVDKLLLAWGPAAQETKLTDGSRLLMYRHATTYDALSPYEHTIECEVSFLAPPPKFRVSNVAMRGDAYECSILAQGHTGYRRDVYVPPPPPMVVPGYMYYR